MERWLHLSERAFPAAEFAMAPRRAERFVGPIPGLFSDADLAAFRACTEADAATFAKLIEHPLHRHLVKLLVLATRHVPEWLLRPLLLAACLTENPSFNAQFVAPCVLRFGRRRVVAELLKMARVGSANIKVGATNALYWGAKPPEYTQWPDATEFEPLAGLADESIDDLAALFELWAVEEFVNSASLEVQRALVRYLAKAGVRSTELGARAIEIARAHPDEFIRARLRYDLGESTLIPPLPHPSPLAS